MSKPIENAVKNLAALYTVIIGVALSVAAVSLVERSTGILQVSWSEMALFGAFLVTLVPFYHGALRHLDDAYLENAEADIKQATLLLDVFLLLLHGLVFVLLGQLLRNSTQFGWFLVGLLTVDVAWGVLVKRFGGSSPHGMEGRWALINFVFVCLGFAALGLLDVDETSRVDGSNLALLILVGCVLRTSIDYWFCRKFYFPWGKAATAE